MGKVRALVAAAVQRVQALGRAMLVDKRAQAVDREPVPLGPEALVRDPVAQVAMAREQGLGRSHSSPTPREELPQVQPPQVPLQPEAKSRPPKRKRSKPLKRTRADQRTSRRSTGTQRKARSATRPRSSH